MKKRNAFTLVELLVVIAIIGVLASLVARSVFGAQRTAYKAASKSLFSQIVASMDNYKVEQGGYPDFLGADRVNLGEGTNAENLVKTLCATNADGSRLSNDERRKFNRSNQVYMRFDNNVLVKKNNVWRIIDAFGNPNIYVCTSTGGVIKKGYPTPGDGISPETFAEIVPEPSIGIKAPVIVFTLRKDISKPGVDDAEDIFSWGK